MPPEILPLPQSAHNSQWSKWLIAAGCLWALVFAALPVRAYLLPDRQAVHLNYTKAGKHWLAGTDAYELWYNPRGILVPRMSGYRYSPLVSACFAPLSMLPNHWAGALWRIINNATYLAALVLFLHRVVLVGQKLTARQQAAWWLLLLPLSLPSMNNGQANVIMLALLLGAAVAVMEKRWNLAALALAGAFYWKLYPLAVALLFVAVYPRQLGWRFLLALLAGLLLPFLLQHPSYVWDQYQAWYLLLANDQRSHFPMPLGYRDFYLLTRWIGHPVLLAPVNFYVGVQLATGALVAGICLMGRRAAWPRQHMAQSMLLLACAWMIVFGPATESCTYILLAPGLAWSLVDAFSSPRSLWTRGILTLVLAICLTFSMANWFADARQWCFPLLPLAGLLFFVERCWHLSLTGSVPRRAVLVWAQAA